MERPADVLPMTPADAPKLDWFTRSDMALRRVPGFGVVLTAMLLQHARENWGTFVFALLAVLTALTILNEFLPKRVSSTGSLPTSSGGPSAPRRRPDPA